MITGEYLLEVSDISKKLSDNVMIDRLNFRMKKGERIAFVGETGSGKTSILKIIGGLIQPDSGTVLFKNEKVKGPDETLIHGHDKIAYLSQHFELRNNYYVHELLSYANELSQSRSEDLFRICKINHLLNRYSDELSGGEKQRVALAAILTRSPEMLLLDEPFSNLDVINKNIIKQVLNDVTKEFNLDIILISHEPADVLPWANTIHVLKSGSIIQSGTPQELYHFPSCEYCAALLGNYTLLDTNNEELNLHFKHKLKGKMFLRPEYLQIDDEGVSNICGNIESIEYFGYYYLINIRHDEALFKINTHLLNNDFTSGDLVHLKPSQKH